LSRAYPRHSLRFMTKAPAPRGGRQAPTHILPRSRTRRPITPAFPRRARRFRPIRLRGQAQRPTDRPLIKCRGVEGADAVPCANPDRFVVEQQHRVHPARQTLHNTASPRQRDQFRMWPGRKKTATNHVSNRIQKIKKIADVFRPSNETNYTLSKSATQLVSAARPGSCDLVTCALFAPQALAPVVWAASAFR
jgi:hypothetical protein